MQQFCQIPFVVTERAIAPLPTPFGSFLGLLPSPLPYRLLHTRGRGTASAWLPGSRVPRTLVMTSSIGIWLLVLNGKLAFVLFCLDLFFLFAWFILKQLVFILLLFPKDQLRQVLIGLAQGRRRGDLIWGNTKICWPSRAFISCKVSTRSTTQSINISDALQGAEVS